MTAKITDETHELFEQASEIATSNDNGIEWCVIYCARAVCNELAALRETLEKSVKNDAISTKGQS